MILRCLEGQRQRPGAVWYPALDGSSWPASAVIPVQTGRNEPGKTSVNSKCAFGIDAIRAHRGSSALPPDSRRRGDRHPGMPRHCTGRGMLRPRAAAARSHHACPPRRPPRSPGSARASLPRRLAQQAGRRVSRRARRDLWPDFTGHGAWMLVTARKGPAEALTARDACGDSCHRHSPSSAMPALWPVRRHWRWHDNGRPGASGLLIASGPSVLIETVRGPQSPGSVLGRVGRVAAIGSAAALSSGQVPAAVYGGLCACVDALVAVLALRWADLALRRLDFLCLAGAVAGLVLLARYGPRPPRSPCRCSGPDRLHPDDGPCLAEAARGDLERIRPVCRSGLAGASGRRLRRVRCRRLPGLPGVADTAVTGIILARRALCGIR